MTRYENQCVECEYCINCGRKKVPVLSCDDCGADEQELYVGEDDGEYCDRCLKHHVRKVVVRDM